MTAREQLAEMAKKNSPGYWFSPDNKHGERFEEYRAVLKWFAAEVERRVLEKVRDYQGVWGSTTVLREEIMRALLKELDLDAAPASCRKCGERIRGVASDGMCGLCAD